MIDLNKKLTYNPINESYHGKKHTIIPLSKQGYAEYFSKDMVTTHKYLDKFNPKVMKLVYDQIEFGLTEADRLYEEENRANTHRTGRIENNMTKSRTNFGVKKSSDQHVDKCSSSINKCSQPGGWSAEYDLKPKKLGHHKTKSAVEIQPKYIKQDVNVATLKSHNTVTKRTDMFTYDKVPHVEKIKPTSPDSIQTMNIKKSLNAIKNTCKYGGDLADICQKEDQRMQSIMSQQLSSRDSKCLNGLPCIKSVCKPRLNNIDTRGKLKHAYNPYKMDAKVSRSPVKNNGYF
jgi:hypothetical protein